MSEGTLEPGVLTIDLVTEKIGDSFRVFQLRHGKIEAPGGRGDRFEDLGEFRKRAPEGVHTWVITVLLADAVPLVNGEAEVELGGSSMRLTGVAPLDVIEQIERLH